MTNIIPEFRLRCSTPWLYCCSTVCQVTEVEHDTLEVVVQHVGRVAEVTNKMDVDNLALLFGQVLLWPDASIPMDFKLMAGRTLHYAFRDNLYLCIFIISEASKNVQVADALIRFNKELFPKSK